MTEGGVTPLARDEATAEADALIARAPQMNGEEWAVKALPVLARIVGQARDYEKALEEIEKIQPATLRSLRNGGVVFDGPMFGDFGNWEWVAFGIYGRLCDADSIARVALAGAGVTDNERTAEEPWCAAEGCQELPVGYDAESDEHYCAKHKEPWG